MLNYSKDIKYKSQAQPQYCEGYIHVTGHCTLHKEMVCINSHQSIQLWLQIYLFDVG